MNKFYAFRLLGVILLIIVALPFISMNKANAQTIVAPPGGYSQLQPLIAYNGNVYLTGVSTGTPATRAVFKMDNAGNITQITGGTLGVFFFPGSATVINGDIYVVGNAAVWRISTTKNTMTAIYTVSYATNGVYNVPFISLGTKIFIPTSTDVTNSVVVYSTDSGAILKLQTATAGAIVNVRQFVVNNGTVFFLGQPATNVSSSFNVYSSDGTITNTKIVGTVTNNDGTKNQYFTPQVVNGNILFQTTPPSSTGTDAYYAFTPSSVSGATPAAMLVGYAGPQVTIFQNKAYIANANNTGMSYYDGITASLQTATTTPITGFTNQPNGALLVLNGKMYGTSYTASNGTELWASDGTDAGTAMVSDIFPGSNSSSPLDPVLYNGLIYFAATNISGTVSGSPSNLYSIWSTDGTGANTKQITNSDLNTAYPFIITNNNIYGYAYGSSNASAGFFTYTLHGTQTITFNPLKEANIGDADRDPGATTTSGLPVTYTSSDPTVASIVSGKIHVVSPGNITITANAAGNANYNPATPVSQPLEVGKSFQSPVKTPAGYSAIFPLIAANGNIYLYGYSSLSASIINIFMIDGSGNLTQLSTTSIGYLLYNRSVSVINGDVYFLTNTGVWRISMTNNALISVYSNTGYGNTEGYNGLPLVSLGSKVFIPTPGIGNGLGGPPVIYNTDDGSVTPLLINGTNAPAINASNEFIAFNNSVYFLAATGTVNTTLGIIRSDGTTAGTANVSGNVLANNGFVNEPPYTPLAVNGKILFQNPSGGHSYFDYYAFTPGIQTGLGQLTYVGEQNAQGATLYQNKIYLTNGSSLVYYDGVTASLQQAVGTGMVGFSSQPNTGLFVFNGKMYGVNSTATDGQELWVSDGTAAGTKEFKDIYPGNIQDPGAVIDGQPNSSNPIDPVIYNGNMYFAAIDTAVASPNYGGVYSIWQTDGTSAGTIQISTSAINAENNFAIANNVLYGYGSGDSAIPGSIQGLFKIILKQPQTITFGPIATQKYGIADFDPGASSSVGLPIVYTSSDPTVATVVAGKVHLIAPGTATITASVAPNAAYNAVTPVSQQLTVVKGDQLITFNTLPTENIGMADLSPATVNSGLPITYTSSDPSVATVVNGNIHIVSAGSTIITAAQPGNSNYNAAAPVIQTIETRDPNKTDQTITFPPIPTSYLGNTDLDPGASTTSSLALTYTSSNPAVAAIVAGKIHMASSGTATITAIQAGNSQYNPAISVSQSLTVQVKAAQTITFGPLNAAVLGDADITPGATDNAGLPITYSSSNSTVATIVNGAIHIVGPGTTNITASQAGDVQHSVATSITQPLTVNKKTQTITFAALATHTYGDADIALGATDDAGLPITYATSDNTVASIVSGKVHIIAAGTVNITASAIGNANYNDAVAVTQQLTINKAAQTITFNAITTKNTGAPDFSGAAVASSALPVTYTSSDATVAKIVNGNISIVGSGYCLISASQAGNGNYSAATPVVQSLYIIDPTKLPQTISFAALQIKYLGNADFAPGATATSQAAVVYTSSNPAVATIVSGQIHITGIGATTITAAQSGNAQYNPATVVAQTFTVDAKIVQTISFTAFSNVLSSSPDISIVASSTSGLPLTFVSSNPAVAVISNGKVHINGAGSVVITATQTGNDMYAAAAQVQRVLNVSAPPVPVLTFSSGAKVNLGIGKLITPIKITNTGSIVPANFTGAGITTGYTVSPALPSGLVFDPTTLTITGTPVTALAATNFTFTGATVYNSGSAILNITITAPPTLSYATPQKYINGTTISTLSPTVNGVAGFSYNTTSPPIVTGLAGPYGTAVDAAGNAYVADYVNNQVLKIPAGGGQAVPIGKGFFEPGAVAVDAAGNIFVADAGNNVVKEIPAAGGDPVTICTGLNDPLGIAVDASDNVYVSNYGSNTVLKITLGNATPTVIASGFNRPIGIAVDASGTIYVADSQASAIYKIPVGGTPVFMTDYFYFPTGVAVDNAGNVYVADYGNNSVSVLKPSTGSEKWTPSALNSTLSSPFGLAMDNAGNMFVSDAGTKNVVKISPAGGYFISPALPAGLNFDRTTGIISGTPTVESPATNYTVTGYNAAGGTAANVNITVGPVVVPGQLTNLAVSNVTNTSATISWVDGALGGRGMFILQGTTGTANPAAGPQVIATLPGGTKEYNYEGYSPGDQIGSSGWFCYYNGVNAVNATPNGGVVSQNLQGRPGSLTVTGLKPGTQYRVTMMEFNFIWTNTGTNQIGTWLTAGQQPVNFTTTGVAPLTDIFQPGSNASASPLISSLGDEKVAANNILSPNGDGINDTWIIKNLGDHPNNRVTVFDAQGKVVFVKQNYANDWAGTYNGSVLKEGTYYYSIDLGNGSSAVKGFITLVRDR